MVYSKDSCIALMLSPVRVRSFTGFSRVVPIMITACGNSDFPDIQILHEGIPIIKVLNTIGGPKSGTISTTYTAPRGQLYLWRGGELGRTPGAIGTAAHASAVWTLGHPGTTGRWTDSGGWDVGTAGQSREQIQSDPTDKVATLSW